MDQRRRGSGQRLTERQQQMVAEQEQMVQTAARQARRQWRLSYHEMEEIMSHLWQGVCLAALEFDSSRGLPFEAWARVRARYQVRKVMYRRKSQTNRCAWPMTGIDMDTLQGGDAPGDGVLSDGELEQVVLGWRQWSTVDRRILRHLCQGKSQTEIAALMGVSKQAIHQRVEKMRPRVRNLIKKWKGE